MPLLCLLHAVLSQGTQLLVLIVLYLISLFLKEKCDIKFVVAVFSGGHKINFHSTLKT